MAGRDIDDQRTVLGRLVAAVAQGAVVDLVGILGSGRTSLLRAAREHFEAVHDGIVVALNGALYTNGTDGQVHVVRVLEDLRDQVHGQCRSNPDLGENLPWEGQLPPTVASVAETLRRYSARNNLVLLVDDTDMLGADVRIELYRVLQLIVGRSTVAAVLARASGTPAPPRVFNAQTITLEPLRFEDVAAHFASALPFPVDDAVVQSVLEWSGGYPPAVVAAANRMRETDDKNYTRVLTSGIIVPEAQSILQSVPTDIRRVVDVAGVLRTATITDLLNVVDRLGRTPVNDVAAALDDIPLLVHEQGSYAFPPFLREHIGRTLRGRRTGDANTDAFDEINEQALRHYRTRLREKLDDPGSVYASWERLEHSETQRLLLEFAYHGGLRTDDKHARFPLASVFFDVVWWWAWYVDSPFLRQLLAAWGSSARGEQDRAFVADLERFRTSYMAMTQSSGGRVQAAAAEAAAALQEIVRSLDLGPAGATNRHVFAITSALLGDARRLLNLQDVRVDQCYASALAAFRENAAEAALPMSRTDMRSVEDDAWCVPWMLYRQADLALDRGKRAVAQAFALDALERALAPMDETDRDLEIIAKCHRVLGDALLGKNPAAAFSEFARVVYAAYVFHATPLPDEYTRRFHREQVQLVMDRLRRLADTHPKALLPIVEELASWRLGSARTDWAELFEKRCWDELQTLLFPREPWLEELDCNSSYCQRVRVVREALGPKLLEPALDARPTRHRIRRLTGRRRKDGLNPVEGARRFSALADSAVSDDHFNSKDDQCWPRWWLDDSAPSEWPHGIEQIDELPDQVISTLRAALEDLSPLRRQVLEFRDVHGWSRTAVSRELGISEDDQMLMLHRARSAVRRALNQQLSSEAPQ